jgi:hypothetical protein
MLIAWAFWGKKNRRQDEEVDNIFSLGPISMTFPSELSSLRSLSSWLGNSTISKPVIRGFGGKDVLSSKR